MNESAGRVVVGMAGEQGLDYGVSLLEALAATQVEVHLVLDAPARDALGEELDVLRRLAHRLHPHDNQAAPISSGSFLTRGMIVAPCSSDAAAAISLGLSRDLVERAADVTLKERRPLVLALPEPARQRLPADALARLEDVPGAAVVRLEGAADVAARDLLARIGIARAVASA
jgi:4-hydroxy-3-polyprenylbenzoate decarboxylase